MMSCDGSVRRCQNRSDGEKCTVSPSVSDLKFPVMGITRS